MARRKKQIIPLDLSNPMLVRDAIVDDLLRKFPLGPKKTLTRADYVTTWDGHPRLEQPVGTGSHCDACGYPDLALYRLNLTGWELRQYIRQRWPELRQAGVTRRANRLEKRMGGAASRTRRAGLPGLWKVSYGWEDYKSAVVFAENEAHALQQAELFFGPAFAGSDILDREEIRDASFMMEGSVFDIAKHNKRSRKDLTSRKAKIAQKIKKLLALQERMEFLETTHDIYGVQAMAESQ